MFTSVKSPSHTRAVEPLPDEVPNGSFYNTGTDWQSRLFEFSVLQSVFVFAEVVDRFFESFPPAFVAGPLFRNAGEFLLEKLDNTLDVAGEHPLL